MGAGVGAAVAGLMGAFIAGDTLEAVGIGVVVGILVGLAEGGEKVSDGG